MFHSPHFLKMMLQHEAFLLDSSINHTKLRILLFICCFNKARHLAAENELNSHTRRIQDGNKYIIQVIVFLSDFICKTEQEPQSKRSVFMRTTRITRVKVTNNN